MLVERPIVRVLASDVEVVHVLVLKIERQEIISTILLVKFSNFVNVATANEIKILVLTLS